MEIREDGRLYCFEEDIYEAIEELGAYVEEKKLKFDGVYHVPRGGVVLAVYISHRLDIPILAAPHKNSLVVDDVADSGRALFPYAGKYFTYTMFHKPQSAVLPDKHWRETNRHVVFPWEAWNRKGAKNEG